MASEIGPASTSIPPEELALLRGAERRIQRIMWWLGACGTAAIGVWRGWSWAAGFAIGALLSGLNFQWMKTAVGVLAETFLTSSAGPSGEGPSPRKPRQAWALARFILRYALIGLAGYAIFLNSAISLTAFLAGLFVSIAALMVEAAYQVFHDLRGSSRMK